MGEGGRWPLWLRLSLSYRHLSLSGRRVSAPFLDKEEGFQRAYENKGDVFQFGRMEEFWKQEAVAFAQYVCNSHL